MLRLRPSTTKPRRQGRTLTSSEKKARQTNSRLETIEQLECPKLPKVTSQPGFGQTVTHGMDRLIFLGHTFHALTDWLIGKAHNAIRHLADYVLVLALLFAVGSDLDGDESALAPSKTAPNSPIGP